MKINIHSFFIKLFPSSLMCIATTALAGNVSSYPCKLGSRNGECRVAIRHIEAGGIGYEKGYTTLEGFVALDPEQAEKMPFMDLRGHVFDDGTFAANAGIGLRGMNGQRIYGLNAYYDFRNLDSTNYNQMSLGFESIGKGEDFRINGYLPVGKKLSPSGTAEFSSFVGHQLLLSQPYQLAMKGANAELGFHLQPSRRFALYPAMGPYFYAAEDSSDVWGAKARIKGSFGEYITLEASDSYDHMFGNNFQVMLSLIVPLKAKSSPAESDWNRSKSSGTMRSRMLQSVDREEIIALGNIQKIEPALDPATGLPLNFIFVDNTSHSLGTIESPYPTLLQAQYNSTRGDIIYILPGDGTTTNMDQGIILKNNQKLWGSGIAHTLSTAKGTIIIPRMTTNTPIITNSNIEGPGVTLAANNEISGLTISQTSGQAIFGTNPQTFSLSYCTLEENGQAGQGFTPIYIAASSPLVATFDHNIFTNNINGGVYIELQTGATSSQIAFTNNIATNNQQTTGGGAILNIDPNGTIGATTVIVSGNTATNNAGLAANISNILGADTGSFSSFSGSFTNNNFSNNSQGINFSSNANTASLSVINNNLSLNANGGISLSAGNDRISTFNVTINANQINGASADGAIGVALSAVTEQFNLALTNNSINDNNTSGILYYNNSAIPSALNFTISNNTIQGNTNVGANAGGGISIDGFNTLEINLDSNNLSNNTNGSAIGLYGEFVPQPTGIHAVLTNNSLTQGDSFNMQFWGDTPTSACASFQGNTSTTDPAYILVNQGTGAFTLTPSNYATVNTGGFDLTGVVIGENCS